VNRGLNPKARQAELEPEPPQASLYRLDFNPKDGFWYLCINTAANGYWPIEQFMTQEAGQKRYAQVAKTCTM
jgi:hypothetical protein